MAVQHPTQKKTPRPAATAGQATRPLAHKAPAPAPRTVGSKVRATALGYYDHTRRRIGDVFRLHKVEDFSAKWMEPADADTPEHTTLGSEVLKKQYDEIAGVKARANVEGMHVGDDNVSSDIVDKTDNPLGAE